MTIKQSYKNRPKYVLADCGVSTIDMRHIGNCLAQKYGTSNPDNAESTILGFMLTNNTSIVQSTEPVKENMPTEIGAMLLDTVISALPKRKVA